MGPLPHADEILDRLASGESLRNICETEGFPSQRVVRYHVVEDANFASQYARARRIGLDCIAEEILAISDTCRPGEKIEKKHIGWQCGVCKRDAKWQGSEFQHSFDGSPLCEDGKAIKVYEEKTITSDMVERARLQVDARKWFLSKLRPDKYGDRIAVGGVEDAPIHIDVSGTELLKSRMDRVAARINTERDPKRTD